MAHSSFTSKKRQWKEKVSRRQLIFHPCYAKKEMKFVNSSERQHQFKALQLVTFHFFQPIFSHQQLFFPLLFFFNVRFTTIITHSSNIGSSSAKSSRARRRRTGSESIPSDVFRNEIPEGRLYFIGRYGKIKTGKKKLKSIFSSEVFLNPPHHH